jgi:AcrR family transcriptional regulator
VQIRKRGKKPLPKQSKSTARPEREGLRERKRRQTRQRIIEAGLRLFIANGFEGTTLDAIAEAADISRRTFFYYFKSKEDLVLAWQSGAVEDLRPAILKNAPDRAPLDVVRNTLLKLISRYTSAEMVAFDRLMRSTETLRARKQARYLHMEQELFSALSELWPQPERRTALRLVAMVSIGAHRLAMEAWNREGGKRPATEYLEEAFAGLRTEI